MLWRIMREPAGWPATCSIGAQAPGRLPFSLAASRRRDVSFAAVWYDYLRACSAVAVFESFSTCDASLSASLFSRVADGQASAQRPQRIEPTRMYKLYSMQR